MNKYVEDVKKTELRPDQYETSYDRLDPSYMRLLHGAIGISTEGGELLDAIKKFVYYGRPLDRVNIIEEIGDLFWYAGIIADYLNTSFEEIQKINIEKLRARYPNKFTETDALHRNLEVERKILESSNDCSN